MTDRRRYSRLAGAVALATTLTGCASASTSSARPSPFPGFRPTGNAANARPTAAVRVPDLVATALSLRGVKYQFGGVDPMSGFDCSGLVRFVFQQYAVSLPRTVEDQFKVGDPVGRDQVAPGDLIFFSTTAPGATHVGLVLDDANFVHAPGTGAVVRVERFDTPYWRPRVAGIRRITAATP